MIKVINIKDVKTVGYPNAEDMKKYLLNPCIVYIGRANSGLGLKQSVLHNPFHITAQCTREQSVAKYAEYISQQLKVNKAIQDELARLIALYKEHGKLALCCYCSLKLCHGHVLAKYIEKHVNG